MRPLFFIMSMFFAALSFSSIKAGPDSPLNEHFIYNVYYQWGIIRINGGVLYLSSTPDTLNGDVLNKIEGVGKSASKWSWLFELEDYYTSWCYPKTFLPVKSIKNTNEGGFFIHNNYFFNYSDSLIYIKTEDSRKPLSYDTIKIKGAIFDAQSAAYYMRFLDFGSYHPNDTVTLSIIMDGVLQKQKIVYRGREIYADRHKNRYGTFCFTAVVDDSKLFSSSDAINVWISDDDKRIPLCIEANIIVGHIEVLYDGSGVQDK